MKTLQEFWHWFDHEQPDIRRAGALAKDNLSPLAAESFSLAIQLIGARSGAQSSADWQPLNGALRDLSLELCRALEKMCANVPRCRAVTDAEWARLAEGREGPEESDDEAEAYQ